MAEWRQGACIHEELQGPCYLLLSGVSLFSLAVARPGSRKEEQTPSPRDGVGPQHLAEAALLR